MRRNVYVSMCHINDVTFMMFTVMLGGGRGCGEAINIPCKHVNGVTLVM